MDYEKKLIEAFEAGIKLAEQEFHEQEFCKGTNCKCKGLKLPYNNAEDWIASLPQSIKFENPKLQERFKQVDPKTKAEVDKYFNTLNNQEIKKLVKMEILKNYKYQSNTICAVCKTTEQKDVVLVPINKDFPGYNETTPIHLDCILDKLFYFRSNNGNEEYLAIYIIYSEENGYSYSKPKQ